MAQPPLAASAQPVRLDGIAAVIGGVVPGEVQRTILRSDVELRARLSLLGHDVPHALLGELPASLLAATLDELLGEQLISAEAERVQIARPTATEVVREVQSIEQESGGSRAVGQLLDRLDADRDELEAMARRRALISAFLRANLEGATVVTEREVDERLRADAAHPPADAPARPPTAASPQPIMPATANAEQSERRATVRAAIAREALTRNIERWVRVLRARTPVRVFASYEVP